VAPAKKADVPPAPKTPEMALPLKNARVVKPQTKEAPKDAAARTPSTGEPQEGSTRVDTGARGKGFGLTTAGGGGTGVQLDVANFADGPQAPAPAQAAPQQPSEIQLVISGEPGTPPRYAVPDFISLSPDTGDIAKMMGQVLWDDLNFEREFYMIPRDTYSTI